jgi:hypothetical protein
MCGYFQTNINGEKTVCEAGGERNNIRHKDG